MTKRVKFIIAGITLIIAVYFSFYYYVTKRFESKMKLELIIPDCLKKQFKTDKKLAEYIQKRISETLLTFPDTKCGDKVGYFLNPYKRIKSIVACESRNNSYLLSQAISIPELRRCKCKKDKKECENDKEN